MFVQGFLGGLAAEHEDRPQQYRTADLVHQVDLLHTHTHTHSVRRSSAQRKHSTARQASIKVSHEGQAPKKIDTQNTNTKIDILCERAHTHNWKTNRHNSPSVRILVGCQARQSTHTHTHTHTHTLLQGCMGWSVGSGRAHDACNVCVLLYRSAAAGTGAVVCWRQW